MIVPRIAKFAAILLATAIAFGIAVRFTSRSKERPSRQVVASEPQPSGQTQPETTELVFVEPIADLGSRKGVVEHRFVFQNQGSQTITLGKIIPSCACTLIEPDRTEIGPGEKGWFGVKVDLAKEPRGFKRFSIDVNYKCDGPRRKWLELTVNHDPDVQVSPLKVVLAGIAGDAVSGRFTVIDFREHPLEITEVKLNSTVFKVRIVEKPDVYMPGWKYTFEVSADTKGMNPGVYRETIGLDCDPPAERPLSATVELTVLPRIYLKPAILILSKDEVRERKSRQLIELLDHRGDGSEIEIDRVSCSNPNVTWQIEPSSTGGRSKLRVGMVGANSVLPQEPTKITIQLKRPWTQELVVYVSFR